VITVLFFAQLREQLDTPSLELAWTEDLASVQSLRSYLGSYRDSWAGILAADNILCAVNQQQADSEDRVADGDEIAFFPPVTGG
jgi:molybdopterin synthase sulfur carrier subunit